MRILITGGAGFIGSAVVRAAIAAGHEVVNVDAETAPGLLAAAQGFINVGEMPSVETTG